MSFVTMMEGHLAWGDKPLLDNADLTVEAGQRIGLIGRNGTGKSSLLKVLAGIEKLDGGELHTQNGLHAVYVEQEPYFPEAPTVMESEANWMNCRTKKCAGRFKAVCRNFFISSDWMKTLT